MDKAGKGREKSVFVVVVVNNVDCMECRRICGSEWNDVTNVQDRTVKAEEHNRTMVKCGVEVVNLV